MMVSLHELICKWIDAAKQTHPGSISTDQSALLLVASIGGASYIRPDGTVLTEVWDTDDGLVEERDEKMRISALVYGMTRYPELASLLPRRSEDSKDCSACIASGWVHVGNRELVCGECAGLGWVDAA